VSSKTLSVFSALAIALVSAQEKPPTQEPGQEFPRALSEILLNKPAEPGFTSKTVEHANLALGKDGTIHVAAVEVLSGPSGGPVYRIVYMNNEPGTRRDNGFSEPQVVTSEAFPGVIDPYVAIAVDSSNVAHIAWSKSKLTSGIITKSVLYSPGPGRAFTVRDGAVDGAFYSDVRLAIHRSAPRDRIQLAYFTGTSAGTWGGIHYFPDLTRAVVGSVTPVVLGPAGTVGSSLSMALYPNGEAAIGFYRPNPNPQIAGGYIAATNAIMRVSGGPINHLAVTPDSTLHILFENTKYRSLSGRNLSMEETISPLFSFLRLAGDSRNNPQTLGGMSFFKRIGHAWRSRLGIASDGLVPATTRELVMGSDDTLHMVAASGSVVTYSRLIEYNVGYQEDAAMQPAGPLHVNPVTGNAFLRIPLFKTEGFGPQVDFSIVCNSQATTNPALGHGCQHSLDTELIDHRNGEMTGLSGLEKRISVRTGDGRWIVHKWSEDDKVWIAEDEFRQSSWIRRYEGNRMTWYEREFKDGTIHRYESGRLTEVRDPNGNTMSFRYQEGRLVKIERSAGPPTQLDYSSPVELRTWRLQSVTDPSGHVYSFQFDGQGRLEEIRLDDGVTWRLTYLSSAPLIGEIFTPKNVTSQKAHRYAYSGGRLVRWTDPANNETTFAYNDEQFWTLLTDRQGYASTYKWDHKFSQVSEHTNPLGYSTKLTFTPFRAVQTHQDPRGKIESYTYAVYNGIRGEPPKWVKDNRETVLRPGNATASRTIYNARSQPLTVTDAAGATTRYVYDDTMVNVTQVRYPGRQNQEFVEYRTYTGGRLQTVKDASGSVATYEYGAAGGGNDAGTGLVTSIVRAGQRETFFYDVMGRLRRRRSREGAETEYKYNALGWITQRILPPEDGELQPVVSYQHDLNGNVTTEVGPRGDATVHAFDAQDWLIQTAGANGITRFERDVRGNIRRQIGPNGAWINYIRDSLGRVLELERDASPSPNQKKWFTYDANGNVLEERLAPLPDGNVVITRHEYDDRNNRTLTTNPDGSFVRMTYDALDRLQTSFLYAAGGEFHSGVRNEYDRRGLVIAVTQVTDPATPAWTPADVKTEYFHDGRGLLYRVSDNLGRGRQSEYDALGRLEKTFGWQGSWVQQALRTYDSSGGFVESGQNPMFNDGTLVPMTKHTFTRAGKPKTVEHGWNGSTFTRTFTNQYDVAGNLVRTVDEEGTVKEYEYDLLNRRMKERTVTPCVSREVQWEYDADGNVLKFTNALGKASTYQYDHANQRTSARSPGGGIERWTYTPQGWLASHQDAGFVTTSYTRDANGRVTVESPRRTVFPLTEFLRTQWIYDAAGNVRSATRGAVWNAFAYDRQNALTSSVVLLNAVPWKSVSYDNVTGQRQRMVDPEGAATSYFYEYGRLVQVSRPDGIVAGLEYDKGGRLARQEYQNGATAWFTYDRSGHLAQAQTAGSAGLLASVRYERNALGQPTALELGHRDRRVEYLQRPDGVGAETHFAFNSSPASPPYSAAWALDAAENRIAQRTPAGHSTFRFDDDGRLVEQREYKTTVAEPLSASASDTESGFSPSDAISGNPGPPDQVFQGAGWASQTSDSTHSLTVNLAPSQSVASVRLWFPSTRLPRAFRLRVGDQDIEAQKHAVTGAIEVCPGIFRAIQREVEIVFDPIEAGSVMFVQYAGGGSTTSPNSAFVNQIQARRPSEMTVVTSVYDSAGNLERRFKGQTPEETWSHPEETWSHDDRGRIVRYMRRRQGLIEENWSYEYDALGRRLWERNERTGDQEWFVYDGLSDTKIARYKKPPGQAWELDTTYVVTPDHQVLGEVQGSNKAWFLPSSDTNPLAMNQNQNLIYDELTNTFGELVHRTNFGLDPSAQPRIGFAGCEKEAANSDMVCGKAQYSTAHNILYAPDEARDWLTQRAINTHSPFVAFCGSLLADLTCALVTSLPGFSHAREAYDAVNLGVKVYNDARYSGSGTVFSTLLAAAAVGATVLPTTDIRAVATFSDPEAEIMSGRPAPINGWEVGGRVGSAVAKTGSLALGYAWLRYGGLPRPKTGKRSLPNTGRVHRILSDDEFVRQFPPAYEYYTQAAELARRNERGMGMVVHQSGDSYLSGWRAARQRLGELVKADENFLQRTACCERQHAIVAKRTGLTGEQGFGTRPPCTICVQRVKTDFTYNFPIDVREFHPDFIIRPRSFWNRWSLRVLDNIENSFALWE
jgi:YD repeat-containing protein